MLLLCFQRLGSLLKGDPATITPLDSDPNSAEIDWNTLKREGVACKGDHSKEVFKVFLVITQWVKRN